MSQPRELWRLMFLFAALMLPVLLQPDFGSILILAGATGMVLFFSGAPLNFLRQLIPLLLIALVLMLFLFDHVDARLASFFGGETGYQAQHAEEAFAAGGLTGVGPGLGVMKNGHVPEGDTDYILALIAEEWGLVGTGLVWARSPRHSQECFSRHESPPWSKSPKLRLGCQPRPHKGKTPENPQ